MNVDWSNLRLFDDTAVLDRLILGGIQTQVPADGITLPTDVARFHQWILALFDGLQAPAQPNRCGIPAARVADVQALLTRFFPPAVVAGQRVVRPLPVAYRQPNPGVAVYTHDQIMVGPAGAQIPINDGPAALGYIFNIQIAQSIRLGDNSVTPPTYSNYALPLLALYSRCIHLAYYFDVDTRTLDLNNVPVMSCVMYINNIPGQLPMVVGSTYAQVSTDPAAAVLSTGLQIVMNTWRRQAVLDIGLATFQPGQPLPQLSPTMRISAIEAYLNAFRGNSIAFPGQQLTRRNAIGAQMIPITNWDFRPNGRNGILNLNVNGVPGMTAINQIFTNAEIAFRNAYNVAFPGVQIVSVPRGSVEHTANTVVAPLLSLRDGLKQKIQAIIDLRWTPGYNRGAPQIRAALEDFLRFWLVPHMFLAAIPAPAPVPAPGPGPAPAPAPAPAPRPDLTLPELIIPDPTGIVATGLNNALGPLWNAWGTAALDLLDQLFWWTTTSDPHLRQIGPRGRRFGRCAETYPVVVLLPTWTAGRVLPNAANPPPNGPSTIRGFSFEIHRFETSADIDNFSQHFDSTTLNGLHQAGSELYRLPCDNCQALLPVFEIPTGQAHYDADLWAIAPALAPNVY